MEIAVEELHGHRSVEGDSRSESTGVPGQSGVCGKVMWKWSTAVLAVDAIRYAGGDIEWENATSVVWDTCNEKTKLTRTWGMRCNHIGAKKMMCVE